MTVKELEERIIALEKQLQQIHDELATARSERNRRWLDAVEKLRGDEDLLSIFAEAQKLRDADRKRAPRRPRAQRKPLQ